ncbi:hypothetical protein KIPB_016738, partial [Kipferlia bialata]
VYCGWCFIYIPEDSELRVDAPGATGVEDIMEYFAVVGLVPVSVTPVEAEVGAGGKASSEYVASFPPSVDVSSHSFELAFLSINDQPVEISRDT